ncbi:MAG: BACON domain-containing protein, partial [Bryobacteraceae bacterium]|nr:BACON domain-containing protein [Bryobacteraceae bacterium]
MKLALIFATALPLAAQCTFSLNPSSLAAPASPDTIGTFQVVASASNCARTAVSTAPDWLTISFGTTGTGNGTIGYRVDTNRTPGVRTGAIVVGSARFTVTQAAPCTIALNPREADVPAAGATGTIAVTAGCAWTAVPSQTWITVTAGNTGNLNGSISYRVAANTSQQSRAGAINV